MNDGKGERAFPTCGHSGMSMLDYFAAHASEKDICTRRTGNDSVVPLMTREQARYAYADDMIIERESRMKK